jgi:hypoxanthine phosphoribosyltransferase
VKVLTLSRDRLTDLSQQLLMLIQKDNLKIDMLIGIATGGIYVSQPIYKKLQEEAWQGAYAEIKLSRPSTQKKESLGVKKVLTKLPYFLSNILRVLEVKFLEKFKATSYDKSKEKHIHFSEKQIKEIQNTQTLLLIDDAIDTGSTMLALKNVIQKINPSITIKTAVLTVTHKQPYLEPDYTLYKDVLLRCPWAMDYKGDDKIG